MSKSFQENAKMQEFLQFNLSEIHLKFGISLFDSPKKEGIKALLYYFSTWILIGVPSLTGKKNFNISERGLQINGF